MPPERLRQGQLAPPGDVYSFAVMARELWAGADAFEGASWGEVRS